ncbi:PI-PLC X domain-containing protein 1-like isoform X5 [Synchiropus splendidus]|uniref:PI-PLC X domain-containing protein 1-like isoform X5 n=1 Tax=Synchiropus splendidus TaxID=270530 RepID=UPI00237EDC72|nr:PI-PLC X domain-containing protein 1-like isoform X5 [Synchiropus splendidus]
MTEQEMASDTADYSDWMAELPPELLTVPLWNVALPGSHDCMSYDLDINSAILEPDSLTRFSKIGFLRKVVCKWATTQTVLEDINGWATLHPKEILILSFSHFKNFEKNPVGLHLHLLQFIETLFGPKLIYRKCCPTMELCWNQKRNVLIAYDFPGQIDPKAHPNICGKIPYYYGNTMNLVQVESKILQTLESQKQKNGFFVCGLNLTLPEDASVIKYILKPFNSLAKVIEQSLPELVKFMGQRAEGGRVCIFASDLVTHDDFVPTVIKLNTSKYVSNTMNVA